MISWLKEIVFPVWLLSREFSSPKEVRFESLLYGSINFAASLFWIVAGTWNIFKGDLIMGWVLLVGAVIMLPMSMIFLCRFIMVNNIVRIAPIYDFMKKEEE
jgi:hypothetical protein